ncbi:MAG: hypothetical protein DHS20C13_25420 [Thermodesulfobacteriota bacterium]|nr:MAG: hypothetical protein DHS20C13_25420 [Thermodesulfobacteriota bacterium]GJM36349.1 MAG: hypothetical protein DHS20C18_53500 [Saprospiraceae bacterium]
MRLRDENLFEYTFEELMKLFKIKEEYGWIVGELMEASEHLKSRNDLSSMQKDALYSYYPYAVDDIYFYLRDKKNDRFEYEFTNLIIEIRFRANPDIQDLFEKFKNEIPLSEADKKIFQKVYGNRPVDQVFNRLNYLFSSSVRKEVLDRKDKLDDIEFDTRKVLYQIMCVYRRRQFLVSSVEISRYDVDAIEDYLRSNQVNDRVKSYLKGIRMSTESAKLVNSLISEGEINKAYKENGYSNLVKYFAIQKFHLFISSGLMDNPIINLHSIRGFEVTEHDHLFESNNDYVAYNGYLDVSEDDVQLAIERILKSPFHKEDWGGEENDLYSNYVAIDGIQNKLSVAFLLKGNGLRKKQMQIRDLGKNGDQFIRLFQSPAELFVLQFVGNISENVIKDFIGKCRERRLQGIPTWGCIIDGTQTSKIMKLASIEV